MNEVEKLYENAGIKKKPYCELNCSNFECTSYCLHYEDEGLYYPLFTAEKQIEVENIIFQCNFGVCELQRTMPAEFTKDNKFVKHYFAWQYQAGDIGYSIEEPYGDWDVKYSNPDRKEALAGFVNALWDEYLTEEERQQIRDILESEEE